MKRVLYIRNVMEPDYPAHLVGNRHDVKELEDEDADKLALDRCVKIQAENLENPQDKSEEKHHSKSKEKHHGK